ncbi:MAG: DUF2510 domain-containing protein [Ilumatobacteraceae bacterium]
MSQPAKWWPDPYGRFEQRYFDGEAWTAHVISSGKQTVDPLGTTVSVPFAAPTSDPIAGPAGAETSATTPSPVAGVPIRQFLDGLGAEARTRSAVHLSIALAGVGGVVAAAGIGLAILGDSGSSRSRNLTAAIVIMALAYAIRLGVKSQPEARSAAVGAAAVGIPALAVAITNTADGGGTAVLAAVFLIAAWAAPGMRGRPLLLGEGAASFVLALSTFDSTDTTVNTGLFNFGPTNVVGGKSWMFVIAAVLLLALVWWLDAQGYHGVGTSLVVAAVLSTAFAVLKVVENLSSTSSALLLAVAGLAVAVVGDHGQRRASTWFGVAVAAIGTVAAFVSALEPSSTGDIATSLILAGLAMVVVPLAVKAVRASRASGGSVAPL